MTASIDITTHDGLIDILFSYSGDVTFSFMSRNSENKLDQYMQILKAIENNTEYVFNLGQINGGAYISVSCGTIEFSTEAYSCDNDEEQHTIFKSCIWKNCIQEIIQFLTDFKDCTLIFFKNEPV